VRFQTNIEGTDRHYGLSATLTISRAAAKLERAFQQAAFAGSRSVRRFSLLRHLRDGLLHPFRHLCRRDIFFVRRHRPGVSERISHPAVAVVPKHVGERGFDLCAGRNGLVEEGVHVLDVKEDAACVAAQRLRRPAAGAGHLVREHNPGIADLDFRVSDLSARTVHAHHLLRAERSFVKVEHLRGVVNCQIRRYRLAPVQPKTRCGNIRWMPVRFALGAKFLNSPQRTSAGRARARYRLPLQAAQRVRAHRFHVALVSAAFGP
jgi:hypothetical protein